LLGVLAGMALVAVLMLRRGFLRPADEAALEHVRQRTRHLERMLPATGRERSWFFALAVTAGICEELLYRGYIIWYLSHWFAIWPAAALAAVVFGIGHAYQGWRGVITTAFVGAFLAAVYILTGSLYPGMIMHALMDAHSGHLMQRAYERERVAAEEVAAPERTEAPAVAADAGEGRG
jgi:hypothetical protein